MPDSEEVYELHIDSIAYGGKGVGRTPNGMTVFVPKVVAGDYVRVQLIEKHSQSAHGQLLEILKPSPDRREAPCIHYEQCGGCQLQHLTYEAQCKTKVAFIVDALKHIGRIEYSKPIDIITSPEWNYRSRVQFKVGLQPHKKPKIGFFSAGSNDVCEIQECLLLDPILNDALGKLREAPPGSFSDKTVSLAMSTRQKFGTVYKHLTISHPKLGFSIAPVAQRIRSMVYGYDARCFFQINRFLMERLVEEVIRDTNGNTASGDIAVDLYAGVGLFTLALAENFRKVYAAEEAGFTAHQAIQNVARNRMKNILFSRQSTESWFGKNKDLIGKITKLVVDPPRVGMSKKVIQSLIKFKPKQITYISCNPATLARDLSILCTNSSYKIHSIVALDMFPQTYHVETVVHLA